MSALTPVSILFEGAPGTVTQFDADLLGNKYLQGLRDVVLDGQGGGYQVTTSRAANTDDRFERPFNTAGVDENNGRSFEGKVEFSSGDLINEALKGTKRLTFTTPGTGLNTARYRVGGRIRLASEDTEGQDRFTGAMGYPDACARVEDMLTITAIAANGDWLEVDKGLEYDHYTDVRDWPTDWGGTGLPRVLSLDRTPEDGFDGYTYLDSLTVQNFKFLAPANGGLGYFITPAHNFTITNCDVDIYNQFSQILGLCTSTGNTFRKGCEDDKAVGHIVSTGDKFLGEEPSTNGRWKTRLLKNGLFERSNCLTGRWQEYQATTFTSGPVLEMKDGKLDLNPDYGARYPQPGHKPVDLLIYRAGQTFASHPASTAQGHLSDAPHDFYTVTLADESTDLLVPAPAWTPETSGQPTPGHDFFRTTCEGMCISTVNGSKSGYITHRAWDEARDCYVYSGTWPRFSVQDKLVYSYVRNLVDEGGHTVDERPLFNRNSLRFQGNTGTGGSYSFYTNDTDIPVGTPTAQVPVFGTATRLTVNVTEAQPGATLTINNYPMATMPDGSTSRRICRIDLSQTGIRSFTATQATGTKGTDSFDLSAMGWVEAFDYFRPMAGGKVLTLTEWSNDETPLDGVATPPPAASRVSGQFPVDVAYLTSMQAPPYPTMDTLFAGNTTPPPTFYGQALYNPYSVYHDFPAGSDFELKRIDIGDYQNNLFYTDEQGVFHDFSFKIYGVRADKSEALLVTYDGAESYGKVWEYPVADGSQYKRLRYQIQTGQVPNYIKLYGDYTPTPPRPAPPLTKYPLGNHTFTNFHIWNLMEDINNASIREDMYAPSYALFKQLGGGRLYLDVKQLCDIEDDYRFNYTYNGYDVDRLLERFKQDGQHVVVCLKETPAWLNNTYPNPNDNFERVPIAFGANKLDPASYARIAEVYFQFAARYGSNPNVNPALVKSRTGRVFGGAEFPAWRKSIGLGYVAYMEIWNEVDKWWKGLESNLDGAGIAVFMHAVYTRIKQADPAMHVSTPGVAYFAPDVFRGFVEKSRELRGLHEDGSVNLPCDNYHYHVYPNTADTQYSGSESRGMAIELSAVPAMLADFQLANYYGLGNLPLECGETGYDWGSHSPLRAQPPAGSSLTPKQWAGVLNLRIALFNAKHGVRRTYFFDWKDVNSTDEYGQFSTSGIVEEVGTAPSATLAPRATLLLLAQLRALGRDFAHDAELSASPLVDRWKNGSQTLYSLHLPTENNGAATYSLNLPAGGKLYRFALDSATTPPPTTLPAGNNTITVTETPVFILAS